MLIDVTWQVVIGLGLALQVIGLVCFLNFYFRKKPALPSSLPGITVIKPCYKIADWEDKNFDTYFNQDYQGPVELIFVVSENTDPAVPLINDFVARYPGVDAKLLISKTRKAYWQKIDAYYDGFQQAKHDLVIISDSDTIVAKHYLTEMVAALCEPGVSMVTTPQYDTGVSNFPTALKTMGNNCDIATYIMILDAFMKNKTMGWGHSIGFRRSEFAQFGEEAWDRLRHFYGDDLVLPQLFVEHGKKVVYSNIYCPVQFTGKSMSQMMDQQQRFAICQRVAVGNFAFAVGPLIIPHVTAFLYMLYTGFDTVSVSLFLTTWLVRTIVSFTFEGLIFKTVKDTVKWFWTIPIWDVMKIYFVGYAFTQKQVSYHGKVYEIRSSRVEPVENPQT